MLDMALARDEKGSTRLYSMSRRFMEQRDAYYARHLTKTSSATAQRDLADLVAKGVLQAVGSAVILNATMPM